MIVRWNPLLKLRKHALHTQIMTKLMPKLIQDVIKNYSNEILMPKVTEKVDSLLQHHDEEILKRKALAEQEKAKEEQNGKATPEKQPETVVEKPDLEQQPVEEETEESEGEMDLEQRLKAIQSGAMHMDSPEAVLDSPPHPSGGGGLFDILNKVDLKQLVKKDQDMEIGTPCSDDG